MERSVRDPASNEKHRYVSCCLNKANSVDPDSCIRLSGVLWECKVAHIIFITRDSIGDLAADFYGVYVIILG